MKILQFVPYYLPYNGGQERYIYNLCRYLSKKGHSIDIITSDYPRIAANSGSDANINLIRLKCLFRPLRNPIVPEMILKSKIFDDYDIVHIHNEHSFSSMIASLLKTNGKAPLILTCHGKLIFGNRYYDNFERLYNLTIGKSIIKKSDKVVVLSNSDKEYIKSLYGKEDKIQVLPNAIDNEELDKQASKFSSLSQDDEIHGKFDKIILFVGPVIKRKGVEYLIESMPSVLRSTKLKILFILTGHINNFRNLKELIYKHGVSDNILLTGYIDRTDLIKFYMQSDLFILPSFSEGLPTSILEAMYFGVPVIATNLPSVSDHFKNTAYLIKPRDSYALSEAIIKLLNDDILLERLSLAGKRLVRKKYLWKTISDEYEKIYGGL